MATNIVLIDFENVQPRNLEILQEHPFVVYVFVGQNQTKIPFELASAMQLLGDSGRYIKISGSGKDSLDFHIAYYIGELASEYPDGCFHIISKDKGFDPLIKHLRSKRIKVQRECDLAEIPVLRISATKSTDEKISAIVKNLISRGQSRPRKVATLIGTIKSLFAGEMSDKQALGIVKELESRKQIKIADSKVSYQLTGR